MYPTESNEARGAGQRFRASVADHISNPRLPHLGHDIHDFVRGSEDKILQAIGIVPDACGRHQHCPFPDHKAMGLPVAAQTLAKLHCISSNGPPTLKFGRLVRLRVGEFKAWLIGRTSAPRKSTSDRNHTIGGDYRAREHPGLFAGEVA
jgi:hypothetical protein